MTEAYQTIESGEGFPLLLLHGMMGEMENWASLIEQLPNNCRAIALHLPFFEDGKALSTVPEICDYVKGYLDSAGLERVVLGGNSLGGHVSLRLAMELPDRIAGLVLTGSSGLFERELGTHRGANPSREWYRNKMKEIFYDPAWVTEDLVNMVCTVLETRRCRRVLVSMAKSAKRDNLAEYLGRVQCPCLLVWGRQDSITPPEVAEEFRSLIPRAELVWLGECGHAAMIEQPRAFARELCTWWKRNIPAGRSSRTARSFA